MTKPTLLLVEDDRALADLLMWHFDREGYEIVRTADGDEALILAEERAPDLVVLDWMIEGVSGIEVCRRLRRRASTAHVPIIMLTARGEESDRIRGLETGADDYVTKPFSPRELMARVGAVLRRMRPALAGEQLAYVDIEMDVDGARVDVGIVTPDRVEQALAREDSGGMLHEVAEQPELGRSELDGPAAAPDPMRFHVHLKVGVG